MTEYCQKCGIRTTPEEPLCQCIDVLRAEIERLIAALNAGELPHGNSDFEDAIKRRVNLQSQRILELEEELREWRCDTVPGRCRGCPDCQPIGGIRESTKRRNEEDT
jgi:hypothetical protein